MDKKKSASVVSRALSWVDPRSSHIAIIGALQLLASLLPLLAVFVTFPPDFSVWWNLPVPKGARVGIGGYLLLITVAAFFVWHSISLILRQRWAIVVAGLPYLALGVWRLSRFAKRLATREGELDLREMADIATAGFLCLISLYVFLAGLRLVNEWVSERKNPTGLMQQV